MPSDPLRPEWAEISQEEFRQTLQGMNSLNDLASFWGVRLSQLSYYAFRADKGSVYQTFPIPRRDGSERWIDSPKRALKYVQRLLHESLTRIYGPHPLVHGFRFGRSIITNAERHTGSRYVLNLDLEDFFPSITRRRIYGRLTSEPYSLHSKVANLIAALATNRHSRLPQGSPSSPVIANILAANLDKDLAKLCSRLRCRYTRYADDITISVSRGEMPPAIARYPNAQGTGQVILGDDLVEVIEKSGFRVNHRKSRLQSYWTRQMCTGLVVNGAKVSPPRAYIRRLRSLMDHWRKGGWQDAAQVLRDKENRTGIDTREKLWGHIAGSIGYLKMVRGPDDPIVQRFEASLAALPPSH